MSPDSAPREQSARRIDSAGIVIAGILALVAIVLVWDASQLPATTMYGMGPQAMPIIIAIGLGVLAVANLVDAMRGNLPARESMDAQPVLLILAGLTLLICFIGLGVGFIPATSALFVTTSLAFGRRAILVDTIIALVLTTLIYLAFDRLLTLSLPAGPLERLL